MKSSGLLLLTILKFYALSKKSIGFFEINRVHEVHVCISVNSFNSFVSFPESVESSSKLMCSWKYVTIYCFYSENLSSGHFVLGMINSSMTRNMIQKQNHLIRKQQFTLLMAEHLNSFIGYQGFDCLYAHHSISPVAKQQKCAWATNLKEVSLVWGMRSTHTDTHTHTSVLV